MNLPAHKAVAVRAVPRAIRNRVHERHAIAERRQRKVGVELIARSGIGVGIVEVGGACARSVRSALQGQEAADLIYGGVPVGLGLRVQNGSEVWNREVKRDYLVIGIEGEEAGLCQSEADAGLQGYRAARSRLLAKGDVHIHRHIGIAGDELANLYALYAAGGVCREAEEVLAYRFEAGELSDWGNAATHHAGFE